MPARKSAAATPAAPAKATKPTAVSRPTSSHAPPATSVKVAPPVKPVKAAPPATAVKAAPPLKAARPAGSEKPVKAGKPTKAPKLRQKPVRDSFTMPEADFALVATLKARALSAQRETKKSELLRAGLHALAALDTPALVKALGQLEPVKIGRPKQGT